MAGLTPVPSDLVRPPRVLECPVQMEATLVECHELEARDPERRGRLVAIEVRVRRVHAEEGILMDAPDRIDPEKWRPLVMSFCHFFGLGGKLRASTLAEIPEEAYRPRPREGASPAIAE